MDVGLGKKKEFILIQKSGFTLVELMIAASILSVVLLAFTSYLFYQSRMRENDRTRETLNYVKSSVTNAAGQEESIIQSERLQSDSGSIQ